jgi:hypothetical protein
VIDNVIECWARGVYGALVNRAVFGSGDGVDRVEFFYQSACETKKRTIRRLVSFPKIKNRYTIVQNIRIKWRDMVN